MAEPGFIITEEGVDINKAADYEKVVDSRNRIVEVFWEGQIDFTTNIGVPDGYKLLILREHGLGYIPAFEFLWDDSVLDPAFSSNVFVESFSANNKYIYLNYLRVGTTATMRIKGYLRIYAVPITTEYTAPASFTTAKDYNANKRFGIKALRPAEAIKTMSDDQITDYNLHTTAKALNIHKHGLAPVAATPFPQVTIAHNLGYLPTYFCYQFFTEASGAYQNPLNGLDGIQPVVARSAATVNTLSFGGVQSALAGSLAYLILKDPVRLAS